MAENGRIEPEKYGSLLQHSFSTLMDESDTDTISERSSTQGTTQARLNNDWIDCDRTSEGENRKFDS